MSWDASAINKIFIEFMARKKPIFLFVYFGGHGVSHHSKQIGLLNSEDAKHSLFQIENKIKTFQYNPESTSRAFVIFDCCNTPLSGHESLFKEVGLRGNSPIQDPDASSDENKL